MSISRNERSTGLVPPRSAVRDESPRSPSPPIRVAIQETHRWRTISKTYPSPISLRSRATSFLPPAPSPLSGLVADSGILVRVAARDGKSWTTVVLDGLRPEQTLGQRVLSELGISNRDTGDSPIQLYLAKWPSPLPISSPLTENALSSILKAHRRDAPCYLTLHSAGSWRAQSLRLALTSSSEPPSENGSLGSSPHYPFVEPNSPISPGGYDGSDEHPSTRFRREYPPRPMGSSQSLRHPLATVSNHQNARSAGASSPHDQLQRARKHAILPSYNIQSSHEASLDFRSPSRLEALARADSVPVTDMAAAGLGFISLREHLRLCHSEETMLPDLLLNSITTAQKFRRQACKLGPELLCRLTAVLQNCVSYCRLNGDQGDALRLIQDLSTDCLICPRSYRLTGIVRGGRISGGGEATIYAGQHHGRPVVIREFHPPTSNSWDDPIGHNILKLIIREAVMHRQLRHANIVGFVGIWQRADCRAPSLVLEKAEHGSVLSYLQLHPGRDQFLKLVDGVIAGLCYLHSHKPPLIHGDLHDGNIVVDSTGNALICDFGLSRIRYEITRTHTNVREGGRLRYVAPELTTGPVPYRPNEASDTYSLAMTIFALGTGSPPFAEQNEFAAATSAKDGRRPHRPSAFGGLDRAEIKGLWSIMKEMWRAEPSSRLSMNVVQASFRSLFHL